MKKTLILTLLCFLVIAPVMTVHVDAEPMRGVWVSTVYNLDYPSVQTPYSRTLKNEIDEIVKDCSDMGFNAIFLQVRPCGDAIYPSDIFPWSKYLTGSQGLAPMDGFDPLKYWIEKCHEYSMELHAWINPYRITKDKDKDFYSLASDNPAVLNPGWVVKYSDGNYYYNPGIPEVRELIVDGVWELLNYDIDGIHMDDYFYPGTDFNDYNEFQTYNNGEFYDVGDWRRNNVNLLVESIYNVVKESGKEVSFGISPFGIWANQKQNPLGSATNGKSAYYEMYADSVKWVRDGIVDYLAPQLYWEFGLKVADYGILSKWWEDIFADSSVKLYIGLGDYKTIDAKATSPWYGGAEIRRQMEYNDNSGIIDGEIHFRYKMIAENADLRQIITEKYDDEIKVIADGKRVVFDTEPVIVNDRTMVPLRAIFETFGAIVGWDDSTKTVYATIGDNTISLGIGSDFMMLNDEQIFLDSVAFIKNDRTYVPLRAISEAFKYAVYWNGDTKTVTIQR